MTKTISATAVTVTVDIVLGDDSVPAGTRHIDVHLSTAATRALDNLLLGWIVSEKLPRTARRRDALNKLLESCGDGSPVVPVVAADGALAVGDAVASPDGKVVGYVVAPTNTEFRKVKITK